MGRVRNSIIWSAVAVFLIGGSMLVYYRLVIAVNMDVGRQASMEALIIQIEQALAMYRSDYGRYPENLAALENATTRDGPYFVFSTNGERTSLSWVDPWGRPLIYRIQGEHSQSRTRKSYLLYSAGPNGVDEEGQGDDIKVD